MELLLGKILFWICPLLLGLAAFALWRVLRTRQGSRRSAPRPEFVVGALFAAGLTLAATFLYTPEPRVQWDETVLYATSLTMRSDRIALMPRAAVPGPSGEALPVLYSQDKRPPLFPFLVSCAHYLFGAAPATPRWTNLFLFFAFLYGAYLWGARAFGPPRAFLVPAALTGSALVFWTATSGGMDLLAAAAVFALVWSVAEHWRSPSPERLRLTLALGLLASYTRYETGALVLLFWGVCLARSRKKRLGLWNRRTATEAALALALLAPLASLLLHASGSFVEVRGASLFSLRYLPANTAAFFQNFFSLGWGGSYNGWINLAGLGAWIWALRARALSPEAWLLAAASAFQIAVALVFFDGSPVALTSARLFLFPALAFPLASLLGLGLLEKRAARYRTALPLAILTLLVWGWHGRPLFPPSSEDQLANLLDASLTRKADDPKRLLVTNLAFFVITRGRAAVDPAFFLARAGDFAATRGTPAAVEVLWLRTRIDDPYRTARESQARLESEHIWTEVEISGAPRGLQLFRWEGPKRDVRANQP